MRLRWTPKTERQLKVIHDFIARHNPRAAAQTVEGLLLTADKLLSFPELGRPGRRAGTREIVHAPFTIVYRRLDEIISIEAIFRDNLRY